MAASASAEATASATLKAWAFAVAFAAAASMANPSTSAWTEFYFRAMRWEYGGKVGSSAAG